MCYGNLCPCGWFDLRVVIQGQENEACMLGQLGRPETSADVSPLARLLYLGCTQ